MMVGVALSAAEWTAHQVGQPAALGSFEILPGDGVEVRGGGIGILGTTDELFFTALEVTGDFDYQVRLDSFDGNRMFAGGGLMVREAADPGSAMGAVVATPGGVGVVYYSRTGSGRAATYAGAGFSNPPDMWLRLQRRGEVLVGAISYDSNRWYEVGSSTFASTDPVLLGFSVSSWDGEILSRARFESFGPATGTIELPGTLPRELPGPTTRRAGVTISEIMYHPAAAPGGRDLEFVELYNSESVFEDISGFRLSGAVDFVFPSGTILPPGGYLVIAAVPADVEEVYGLTDVLGGYIGRLSNGGETLRLRNRIDAVWVEIPYRDDEGWPAAADGAGHSLVLVSPSRGEADPQAWGASARKGGSPGRWDGFVPGALSQIRINEVLAHTDPPLVDYVELYNNGALTVDLGETVLTDDPDLEKFRIPVGTFLAAGEHVAFTEETLGFALNAAGETVYWIAADGSRVIDALRFGPQAPATGYGRSPDGADDLRPLAMPTAGAPNAAPRLGEVVINEILYHPVSGDEEDEFVELHNRGATAVDLSGWRFTQGIDWTFSAGTVLPPGGYLVVARDALRLRSRYPALTAATCVGDYRGGLNNGGELLRLSSPETIVSTNITGGLETNLVFVTETEVKYSDGGRWGFWPDGLGSSLELVNPGADPMRPSNWAASDETEKGDWTIVEFTGLLEQGNPAFGINQLQLFMLGVGECLVDDVQVIGPSGGNAISNPGFDQGLGNWVPQGSHRKSYWQATGGVGNSGCLHIVAESRGDTGANRVRTALLSQANIRAGEEVTLRAKVRWLRGWPEFLLRIRGNYLEATGRLDTSTRPGTPGTANSAWRAEVGPAIWDVRHDPVLPQADRPVVVSARVQDPDGVASVELQYRIEPSQTVSTAAMRDDGTLGDALAGDGVYSAVLPGQPTKGGIAFSVVATDSGSTSGQTRFPSDAPERECMVRFGEAAEPGSYAAYRIWMTSGVRSEWTSREKLNNAPLDVTFVVGHQRVVYNARSLYAGSPFISPGYSGPTGTPCGYVVRFPEDDRFLGVTDVNLDWPTRDSSLQLEQLAYWMMEELELPRNHRRFIRLYVDGTRRGVLYEDVQQPSSELVAQYFPDDRDGDLFKIEDWFEFDDSGSGFSNRDATLELFQRADGTKNLARYRWNWRKRAVTDSANDYTSLFALSAVASTPASDDFVQGMNALVDIREWLGMIAVEHIVGNWDSFGYRRGKNMYAYKPERGGWALLPWDIDFVLGASSDGPYTPLTSTIDPATSRMFFFEPDFRRAYYRVLEEATVGPLQLERFQPRLAGHADAFAANLFGRIGSYPSNAENFILQRASAIQGELLEFRAVFQVNTPAPTTTQNTVALQGEAPLEAVNIAVNGVQYPVQWVSSTQWVMTVPLESGLNTLEVVPIDSTGMPLPRMTRTFQVNYTGVPSPPDEVLVFNEIMHHPSAPGAEYVELYNASPSTTYDLSGWRVSGLDYTFPSGSLLEPQGYAVLAKDLSAFFDVHGTEVTPQGAFDGTLVPVGETLRLVQPGSTPTEDVVVQEVSFESAPPWPAAAVTGGISLQLQDSRHSLNRIGNWAALADEPATEWQQVAVTGIAQTNRLFVYLSSWPVPKDLLSIEGFWDGYLTFDGVPQLAFQVVFEPGPGDSWLGFLVYGPGPNDRDPIQEVVVEGDEVILNFQGAPGLLRYTIAPPGLTFYGSYNPPGEPSAPSDIRRSRPGGNVFLDDISLVQGMVAETGQNLVANGDFESGGTTSWTIPRQLGTGVGVASWTAHSGDYSLGFQTSIGGIEDQAVMSQVVDGLQVGETYTLSFWWRPGTEGEAVVVRLSDWSMAAYTELLPVSANSAAATPGAENSVARPLTVIPGLWINELQPVNLAGPADGAGGLVRLRSEPRCGVVVPVDLPWWCDDSTGRVPLGVARWRAGGDHG
jgi:regulation of enolase protein 1 (concanavalin A-like superfamily)